MLIELGRFQYPGKLVWLMQNSHVRTPLRDVLKESIGTLLIFESQVKTQI